MYSLTSIFAILLVLLIMSILHPAQKIFAKNGGILRTAQAFRLGISPRTLYELRDNGQIEQLSRGVFRWADSHQLTHPDLVAVATRIPRGVICLTSALSFYEIGTQIPHSVYVALPRGHEPPKLDHPPIEPVWFSAASYAYGMTQQTMDAIGIKIYSIPKTIADCFKFRNRVGLDVAIEALKDTLRQRRCAVDDILRAARINRVERIIRPYLEALTT